MQAEFPCDHIKPTNEPLSSDVYIIKGEKELWIFDAGSNDEACMKLNETEGKKNLIISHFHNDHTYNVRRVKFDNIYASGYTAERIKEYSDFITIVKNDIYIEDGDIKIHIFPIPSSHSKGSLALELNEEYIFMGDSAYAMQKNGVVVFNAGQVKAEIDRLKSLKADKVILSHEKRPVFRKETIIRNLERVYSKRKKDNPYIEVK